MKNLTPTNVLQNAITPFEAFHGRKPDMRTIRAFGSPCYAHIHRDDRGRHDDTAQRGIFLGYNVERRAYNVLVGAQKIVVSRSVVFNEVALLQAIGHRAQAFWQHLRDDAQPKQSI